MTKREAAIVAAFTGRMLGEFSDMQDYLCELEGIEPGSLFTLSTIAVADKHADRIKQDFINLVVE